MGMSKSIPTHDCGNTSISLHVMCQDCRKTFSDICSVLVHNVSAKEEEDTQKDDGSPVEKNGGKTLPNSLPFSKRVEMFS